MLIMWLRIDLYNAYTLEHHTAVALRELALKEVRQKKYPEYPSRMGCLIVEILVDGDIEVIEIVEEIGSR